MQLYVVSIIQWREKVLKASRIKATAEALRSAIPYQIHENEHEIQAHRSNSEGVNVIWYRVTQ